MDGQLKVVLYHMYHVVDVSQCEHDPWEQQPVLQGQEDPHQRHQAGAAPPDDPAQGEVPNSS